MIENARRIELDKILFITSKTNELLPIIPPESGNKLLILRPLELGKGELENLEISQFQNFKINRILTQI